MPFTFSHPAIVLPFYNSKKNPFSVTGLVAGSVVPDFEFLLQLKESAYFGHTWMGLIVFNIPFAVLLSFVFHQVIKKSLISHLPQCLRERFTVFVAFNWRRYFLKNKMRFFVSVLCGILSHFLLDAFTHRDGFFATMHPLFYAEVVFSILRLPVYYILQLATSLLGALYILWLIFKMERNSDLLKRSGTFIYWTGLILMTITILSVRLLVNKERESFEDIIIACIGSFLYALLVVSLFYFKKTGVNKKSPNI